MYKAPLLPELELPVLSTSIPLTPLLPAFEVFSINEPLLDPNAELKPLVIDTRPPLADVDAPPDRTISPPVPLVPDPTVMYTEPPRPSLDVPDPMYNAPLLPALELPVLSTSVPLTPAVPAFDVCSSKAPLLVAVPNPLLIETSPPVSNDDVPADNTMLPPDPLLPDPTDT